MLDALAEFALSRRTLTVTALLLAAVVFAAAAPPTPPQGPAAPKALSILSDTPVPAGLGLANDVRWASDHSAYVAAMGDGLFEVAVDPPIGAPKEIIPARSKPGGFWGAVRVAASSRYIVGAGPGLVLTWRTRLDPSRTEEAFDAIEAVDVYENRLAIVGTKRDEKSHHVSTDGAIAFVGSLDKNLRDLSPITYDILGAGAPCVSRGFAARYATIRYMPDGSLFVAPGFQPGIQQFDPKGKLVRVWDSVKLGVDSPCGSTTEQESNRFATDYLKRMTHANRFHTVDAILPLPQGAGLVVRRVEKGHTYWDLQVLHPDGSATRWSIPLVGANEFFYLVGDVRGGRVLFLLRETLVRLGDHVATPRLILARPPEG